MKTKIRKFIKNIDHRGDGTKVLKNYNLEIEIIHNLNKQRSSYSFDHND